MDRDARRCRFSLPSTLCRRASQPADTVIMVPVRLSIVALSLVAAVYALPQQLHQRGKGVLEAECVLQPATGSTTSGRIRLLQTRSGEAVQVSGQVSGLSAGLHGFHLHQNGVLTNDCKDAGGHFNPNNVHHGAPTDTAQHAGDFGNIQASESGVADVLFSTAQVSLDTAAQNGALGRAIVVHALPDDLGRGNTDESKKTGSAGARIACCVVVPSKRN